MNNTTQFLDKIFLTIFSWLVATMAAIIIWFAGPVFGYDAGDYFIYINIILFIFCIILIFKHRSA